MTKQDLKAMEESGELIWDATHDDESISAQRCPDCYHEGRGLVMMPFVGYFRTEQTVCASEYDDGYPGGIRTFDRRVWCPYAVWICEHDHVLTDGY